MLDCSLLILSCKKNDDLKPLILKTLENFNFLENRFIISDGTPYCDNYIHFETSSFGERLFEALKLINSSYVLILLDDYFVHDSCIESKMNNWIDTITKNKIDAMRICHLSHFFNSSYKIKNGRIFKKINVYDVDFHPTIWNVNCLYEILENFHDSPWEIEPHLSLYPKYSGKKVGFSDFKIDYDELIIGGCFFRKPYNKYCRNIYRGNKKLLSIRRTLIFHFKKISTMFLPPWLRRMISKIFIKNSYSKKAERFYEVTHD